MSKKNSKNNGKKNGQLDRPGTVPNKWYMHAAGAEGVTFHCEPISSPEAALETLMSDTKPVMDSWVNAPIRMSVTIG